jgi:putative holliday junction resolvase
MARIIGLDLGEKRIGVSVSDETMTISTAIDTIAVSGLKDSIRKINHIILAYKAQAVVIGLPLNMNGSKGPQADKALRFAKRLEQCCGCKVLTFDERLTTVQGERVLLSADMSRAKRRRNIDRLASQIMLQAYLDSRKI